MFLSKIKINSSSNGINIYHKKVSFKYHLIKNVYSYKYIEKKIVLILIYKNNLNNSNYYFILDHRDNSNLCEWIFESAIYLCLYIQLKKKYNNLKLVVNEKKNYKKIFIEYFNINYNSVITYDEMNSLNNCIFINPVWYLKDNNNIEIYKNQLYNFISFIDFNKNNIECFNKKRLFLLFDNNNNKYKNIIFLCELFKNT